MHISNPLHCLIVWKANIQMVQVEEVHYFPQPWLQDLQELELPHWQFLQPQGYPLKQAPLVLKGSNLSASQSQKELFTLSPYTKMRSFSNGI
jgi:hypothetical protein